MRTDHLKHLYTDGEIGLRPGSFFEIILALAFMQGEIDWSVQRDQEHLRKQVTLLGLAVQKADASNKRLLDLSFPEMVEELAKEEMFFNDDLIDEFVDKWRLEIQLLPLLLISRFKPLMAALDRLAKETFGAIRFVAKEGEGRPKNEGIILALPVERLLDTDDNGTKPFAAGSLGSEHDETTFSLEILNDNPSIILRSGGYQYQIDMDDIVLGLLHMHVSSMEQGGIWPPE